MKNLARLMILLPLVASLVGCIAVVTKLSSAEAADVAIGPVTKETRSVGKFSKIRVGVGVQATVKVGGEPHLEIEAQQSILPKLVSRIDGETLVIEANKSISTNQPIRASIVAPSLDAIEASGGASVTVDQVKTDRFSLDLSGGARAQFPVEVSTLDGDLSGGARAEITGSAKSIRLSVSGGARLEGDSLSVLRADIDASGGARAQLGNVHDAINANASGGASVRYSGNPASANANYSGGGSVETH